MRTDLEHGALALARAVEADDELWGHPRSGLLQRHARDTAIAEAVHAGISVEQVADRLGVRISDVERMVTDGSNAA